MAVPIWKGETFLLPCLSVFGSYAYSFEQVEHTLKPLTCIFKE